MTQLKCARCGEDWAPRLTECWNCGSLQAEIVPASNGEDGEACAVCGTAINPEDQFCSECGAETFVQPVPGTLVFPPIEPGRRRRRFGLMEVGLIAVALAVLVASVYSVRPGPSRNPTVSGTITLFQAELVREGESCAGTGEYEELAPGGQVTVRNGDDKTIAVAELQRSAWLGPAACRFPFSIPNLPRSSIYLFAVDGQEQVEYSRSQLEDANWRVYLIAGEPAQI